MFRSSRQRGRRATVLVRERGPVMAAERSRRERVERNIYVGHDAGGRTSYVVGYRDSAGKQRWQTVQGGITAARRTRDAILGSKAKGERVAPNPRLTFGEAADRWLAEQ